VAEYSTHHQPSLFAVADVGGNYLSPPAEPPPLTKAVVQCWKQRVLQHQAGVRQQCSSPPANGDPQPTASALATLQQGVQQASLFALDPTVDDLAAQIDPFGLPRRNPEFWRQKAEDVGVAALYFVIDDAAALLLYVGETVKSNQRWKGEHDCKRYILNYVSEHHRLGLAARVNIGFWANAPVQTRDRQRLELALIQQWRSPFNKENWHHWHTPFVGCKTYES
jgi:hypothetical protein